MAGRFGRDRSSSNNSNSRSSFKYLQQSFGRRSRKKSGKTKERFVVVAVVELLLIVVVVGRRKKRVFPNQKLEEGKKNHTGLSLDPPRNHQNHHQQLHFHLNHNQLLQQQEPPSPQKQQTSAAAAAASSFHGFHAHFFQQAQEFQQQQQHHQFLYGIGGLESPPPPLQPPKKRSFLPSSSQTKEYATGLRRKMGDNSTTPPPSSSRFGSSRNTTGVPVGEIVEVQGGHIVRSTGRKDRHSKVCTAKGPRDRRVRLSANTAIQFYDVQDRLGYDRPSKAVDWLIKKAKAAIDELKELPAWTPTAVPILNPSLNINQNEQQQQHLHVRQQQPANENNSNNSSFLPPSMDSDFIADTIKSFFPMGASTESNSSPGAANLQFHHSFPQDLLSTTTSQSQDLRLSLQSFQDAMLLHQPQNDDDQPTCLYSNNPQMSFDGSGWLETNQPEMGRFQRLMSWNAGGESNAGGGGAFIFHAPSPVPPPHLHQQQPMLQTLFGQSSQHQQLLFSQRGPLQSSNTPSVRAWIDPSSAFSNDHHHQNSHSQMPFHHHGSSSLAGFGFANNVGGFSSFRIPARIQGEEEHDGISDKPSSASSDSRH